MLTALCIFVMIVNISCIIFRKLCLINVMFFFVKDGAVRVNSRRLLSHDVLDYNDAGANTKHDRSKKNLQVAYSKPCKCHF